MKADLWAVAEQLLLMEQEGRLFGQSLMENLYFGCCYGA
jgi:hypothetical protein